MTMKGSDNGNSENAKGYIQMKRKRGRPSKKKMKTKQHLKKQEIKEGDT